MTHTAVVALVTLTGGEPVTTSARIADGVGLLHDRVLKLIRRYKTDLEKFGNLHFQSEGLSTSTGLKTRSIAVLNEPMATFLITCMRNNACVLEFKARLVGEFFAMRQRVREMELSTPPLDAARALSDPSLLRKLLLAQLDRADAAEATITAATPAIEFHAAVSASANLQPIANVAKALNTGEIRLFRWLREQRILLPTNIPYQQHIDAGRFRVVERVWRDANNEPRTTPQTMVTGKGVAYLTKRWLEAQLKESA